MELLGSYSDSESDVEELSNLPKSSPPADYFGLNSSTDDEEELVICPQEKPRCHLPIDTLIDSYQLKEGPVGPPRMVVIEEETDNTLSEKPESKLWHKAKRRRIEPAENVVVERNYAVDHTATSDIEPKINVFRPHPLILESLGKPAISSLPRKVKRTLRGHASCVNALQWGLPLDISHLLLSASMDGTVRIWNGLSRQTNTAAAWSRKAHGGSAVRCARWCPEGRVVASGGYDKMLRVTDVETGHEIFRGEHLYSVTCLKYCPNSNLVLSGTQGSVECWDTRQEKKAVRSYRDDFQEVQDIEFLPGGNEFLCCSNFVSRDSADKAIMAWDFRTGAILSNQIFRERYHCIKLRVHPSESCFMAQTNGNYIAMFSTNRPYKMNTKRRLEGHKVEGYWTGFDVSLDGHYVFSGSADGLLHKYNFHRSQLLGTIRVSDEPCLAVASHPVFPNMVAASDWRGGVYICH